MEKCSYCNKYSAESKMTLNTWKGSGRENVTFYFCSESCRNKIEKFSEHANSSVKKFLIFLLITILTLIICLILTIVLNEKRLISLVFGIPIFFLGIIFYRYPFATPETTDRWGLKKSISVIRNSGKILMAIGFLLLLVQLF